MGDNMNKYSINKEIEVSIIVPVYNTEQYISLVLLKIRNILNY